MDDIIQALNQIDPAALSYEEWLQVGMALQHEGCDVSVWENWSARDIDRYHRGECERKWRSFTGSGRPVTGATIFKMAHDNGWTPAPSTDGVMGWDDVITYDDSGSGSDTPETDPPGEQLARYIETLYEPDDLVGFVTDDVFQDKDGKWKPGRGTCYKTAQQLIESLRGHPDDLGYTVGDWKAEAGAWIRFNPLDGDGFKAENVAAFRFALVESDKMKVADQIALYRRLQLPAAALVFSGEKSAHAIVHIDAKDLQEYRQRVNFLYDFLQKHGVEIDQANKNPNRLSRMPGATRNGKSQQLLGLNMGRKSWADWMDFVEGESDELPPEDDSDAMFDAPEPAPPLIEGILRRGHKMLLSGSSKAGKSFLLLELAIAIATGGRWLGFQCSQGTVFYVNLEIDKPSFAKRYRDVAASLGIGRAELAGRIKFWHLRGDAIPLDKLVPKLVRRMSDRKYDAVIIDPIYKVQTGDENSASDMAYFCNQFDRICKLTGCAAIYSHHHSKGAQGMKRAMDRASGSGVFARDPDAQLDMIELELDDTTRNFVAEPGATAWRLESSLREFPNIKPLNFWFEYPIHRVDSGALTEMPAQGSAEAGRMKNKHSKTADEANNDFRNAFNACSFDGCAASLDDIAQYLQVHYVTAYRRAKALDGEFGIKDKKVYRL